MHPRARWLLILTAATALLASPAAAAEPTIEPGNPPPQAPFPAEPPSPWYGAPAVAVDGAVALGLALLVHETDSDTHGGSPALLYGMTAAYLAAGPVVHLANGHAVRSGESLFLRVGALAAGLGLMYALAEPSHCGVEVSEHPTCWAPYGLLLAPVAAILIDDLVLAREPVRSTPPTATLSGRMIVQPGLAMFGVGGSF